MKRLLIIISLLMSGAISAESSAKKPGANTLFKIEGDQGSEHSNVILSFNKDVDWKEAKVKAHGSFLQVDLKNTIIPNSGEFVDLKGPYFKKAVAFQSARSDGALRIFVNGKAEDLVGLAKADVLGKKVIVSVAHKAAALPTELAEQSPADLLKKPEVTPAKDLLQGKLATAALFCAAMFAILIVFMFLKPFLRKRFRRAHDVPAEQMQTLSVHSFSPKQKLALVQVGEEKILLGLTTDHINYIKTIEPKEQKIHAGVARENFMQQPATQRSQAPSSAPSEQAVARKMEQMTRAAREVSQRQQTVRSRNPEPQAKKTMTPAEKVLNKETQGTQLELSGSRKLVKKEDADRNLAVHDIKQLIRDKLKQMPQIS